jgi:dihydrofolate reductase
MFSIIVAMAKNNVIGFEGQMPWHLPADLQHFKQVTMGKPIIMGRKTFESIGRPLPGRLNIVVTRDKHYQAAGCEVVHNLDAARHAAGEAQEVMIIGGATLYQQALPIVDKLYLTVIDTECEGDTFFPEIDLALWEEVSKTPHLADENNPHDVCFYRYQRKAGK